MRKLISPGRFAFLCLVLAAVLALFFVTLYQLQIKGGNEAYEESTQSIVTEETIIAARGNMMDRYGRLLVSNRNCNNLLIDENDLFYSGLENDEINADILQMCQIIEANGDSYNDELPITSSTPWEFTDMSATQRLLMNAWLKANKLDEDASAVEVMAEMRTRYGIDGNYSADEMRVIAAIRYAVNVRYDIDTADYIFAQDVNINTITSLMEADLPGVDVQVGYIREYNTAYAPHILGYTGLMSAEEYETYKEKDYPLNATVGKSGAEAAFEELLHGTDGLAKLTSTSEGVVTSTVYEKVPQPGNNIYLTLDIELQGAGETALATYITNTNAQTEIANAQHRAAGELDQLRDLIEGGSLVVIDVRTGEPLCIATYPTYNLDTFLQDFAALNEDESRPMLNRALQGLYSPGSTFKPCMALAALAEGFIDKDTEFVCTGVYEKYKDAGYAPGCTARHGTLTVDKALTYSCNFFFYSTGDLITIKNIDKYAALLGLGEPTGIELYEEVGQVASPEYKAWRYEGRREASWFAADTIQASIGQGFTLVTPIQLARYCAAIANSGTTYSCSILKSASSYDYSESVYEREPEVLNQVETTQETWDLIHSGMRGAVTDGTARIPFAGFTYTVAAKTGTTETGFGTNDAFFICYAPYEEPEIAVAVALENGAVGANLATMAREVLQYYFDFKMSTQQTENELTLLH